MHKIKEEPFDGNDIEKFCLKINRDMNELLNVYVQNNVIHEQESLSTNKVFPITHNFRSLFFLPAGKARAGLGNTFPLLGAFTQSKLLAKVPLDLRWSFIEIFKFVWGIHKFLEIIVGGHP